MIGKKLLARTALSTALLGSVAYGAVSLTSTPSADAPGAVVAPAPEAAVAPVTTATPDEPVLAPQVGNYSKGMCVVRQSEVRAENERAGR